MRAIRHKPFKIKAVVRGHFAIRSSCRTPFVLGARH
jgi:hypothetical protein